MEDESGKKERAAKKQRVQTPSVKEIVEDNLTLVGLEHWAPQTAAHTGVQRKPFSASLIEDIYYSELQRTKLKSTMLLEVSHYLENYLWKYFDAEKATFAHLMSIIVMVNEKFREGVAAWDCFHDREEVFPQLFERILGLRSEKMIVQEKTHYIVFLIGCFQSLEDAMIRKECMRLVSIQLWGSANPQRIEKELKNRPKLQRHWANLREKEESDPKIKSSHERTFIPGLMSEFLQMVQTITHEDEPKVRYCERFVEFLLDLVSQLPTRRFFIVVMDDFHVVEWCKISNLFGEARLFTQLVEMLRFFQNFEINNYTGEALSEEDMEALQSERVRELQKIAHKNYNEELKALALANIGSVQNPTSLRNHLKRLPDSKLREFAVQMALLPPLKKGQEPRETRDFILDIFVAALEKRLSQLEAINNMPIFPTNEVMWDDGIIPSAEYDGEHCLALPKLNLQFLTFYDYLLRNFDLYRLESAYEIRGDIEDAVSRCNPRRDPNLNEVTFAGWSRRALPVKDFAITKVGKPKLGESKPCEVLAEVNYSIQAFKGAIRMEWETLKSHDVLFLVACKPSTYVGDKPDTSLPFLERYGIKHIRGCEVVELRDESGKLIRDFEVEESERTGTLRTLKVRLDASQYQKDIDEKDEDVYAGFNLLIRRNPKENNFKAVLETIRDLMNTKTMCPEWLHDIFLGYGNPAEKAEIEGETLQFYDTFLSSDHLVSSFPDASVQIVNKADQPLKPSDPLAVPPFSVSFHGENVKVTPYKPKLRGPYPANEPKKNQIPFTPTQVKAIRSGLNSGLTLVVGPPGTGKTDVAVQMISTWYHNYPEQRILLVTHSNQALNQIFEKIMELDIDERHLLRLGHGTESLETKKDFSKFGRVNHMLERRIVLLKEVERLGRSMGMGEDVAYTCETAEHFFLTNVQTKWDVFEVSMKQEKKSLLDAFPFSKFFSNAPQPLFKGESAEHDWEMAEGCWRYITSVFSELRECRAFELLRSAYDRANYLLTKQAKIVAMTCTHAALKRAELISLGFKYDNLLMEEAGQILEIETFIPMLLQDETAAETSRLKRIVLIGDHHQLPPIVKNISFQKYAHFDQSLFARFVRLGVPTVDLDAQGRARPSIAKLYNWRYKELKDLPVVEEEQFQLANPGFVHDFQIIDVPDFDGKGESTPTPFFYQNLGEAEYVVATYMYMRLIGYPANKISILTTYNGQKNLIRDVVNARCGWNPFYGKPKITTVDRYQGQQNDYVLLSLVRTKNVGHIRDIRRLVVAMSRARLGVYLFCRRSLFENCYELTNTFSLLTQRPDKLQLVEGEQYPSTRKLTTAVQPFQIEDLVHMGDLVTSMQEKMLEVQKQLAQEAKQQAEAEARATAVFQQNVVMTQATTLATPIPRAKKGKDEEEEEEEEEDDE